MQYHTIFQKTLDCKTPEDVFVYLMSSLKGTITQWDYFVNWAKARGGLNNIEVGLNTFNYLIGKDDIEAEAKKLLTDQPALIPIVPILLACREKRFSLLKDYKSGTFEYEDYDFSSATSITPQQAVEFLSKSGLLAQLQDKRIKSLVDYVFGVEVGLDSNGRKNRGGTAMEDIVEFFVQEICNKNGYEYLTQATAAQIKKAWSINVSVDKATRNFDFAILAKGKLVLIETNFYKGGGSKLKATAGEYKDLFRCVDKDGHTFIWITDGVGWNKARNPLEETFNTTDYILNLDMVEHGMLDALIALP